ncbi:protein FAM174C [Symphorus nematophorus]
MSFLARVLSVVLVPVCWLLLVVSVAAENVTRPSSTAAAAATSSSSGGLNSTHSGGGGGGTKSPATFSGFSVDSSMIQRALYVLIGITMIGVLYFLIRAVRLKRPVQKKKYGLLSNYDDSVEMEAVDSDEDDTLYEARSLRR